LVRCKKGDVQKIQSDKSNTLTVASHRTSWMDNLNKI